MKFITLGTLITEGDDGVAICKGLFSSLENVEISVQQMVNIASFYKFEGWLINIENEIDANCVSDIIFSPFSFFKVVNKMTSLKLLLIMMFAFK